MRKAAAAARWRGIVQYEQDPIVSIDIARSTYSAIFDSLATMTIGERTGKVLSWYDAGFGYAHRAVELIRRYAELDAKRAA